MVRENELKTGDYEGIVGTFNQIETSYSREEDIHLTLRVLSIIKIDHKQKTKNCRNR